MTENAKMEMCEADHRKRMATARPFLEKRSTILGAVRAFFSGRDFLEVETPTRIPCPAPELHIDAEPSGNHFLCTSPELQMKRLVASGEYPRIFQICRCFRQGELGSRHLPEFSMVEWYRTDGTCEDLMTDCEGLLEAAGRSVNAYPIVERENYRIDLSGGWPRLTVADAFERFAGWTPGPSPDQEKFDIDLVEKVEPALPGDTPVFLHQYPTSMASLAKISSTNPDVAERVELYAGGLELANGFTELTDPIEQRKRFKQEESQRRSRGKPPYPTDEKFLDALVAGMPPCAGMAMGLDRLVMLLSGAGSIDEVVAFP